jgi:hypothetical protein
MKESRPRNDEAVVVGCQLFSLILVLAFWVGVALIIWHFLEKYW